MRRQKKRKRLNGLNAPMTSAPASTWSSSKSIRCLIHYKENRGSKPLFKKFSLAQAPTARPTNVRREPTQLLRRAQATQCLPCRRCLRGDELAADPNRDPGFSFLRNSQLDGAFRCR